MEIDMVKSLTSLVFIVFFCAILAATFRFSETMTSAMAKNSLAATHYLATHGDKSQIMFK
jgi:hypothetical protein